MADQASFRLEEYPVHLGLGATAVSLPRFTGDGAWYEEYSRRFSADGVEGRLVALHSFTESWPTWEVHPHGHELVVCTAGSIDLIQEVDGTEQTTTIVAGEAVVNPPGVWHTADVVEPTTVLFVTAGAGTELRPR